MEVAVDAQPLELGLPVRRREIRALHVGAGLAHGVIQDGDLRLGRGRRELREEKKSMEARHDVCRRAVKKRGRRSNLGLLTGAPKLSCFEFVTNY